MTHSRSCLLDSFAYILRCSPERLIKEIGHDGGCDGHHTQELIDASLSLGYASTMIERDPISLNPKTGDFKKIEFKEGADNRFIDQLLNGRGLLLGTNHSGRPHAVSWSDNLIWDPSTGTKYNIRYLDINGGEYFQVKNFLRIDKIK